MFDIIIKNGTIIDTENKKSFLGNICINKDKIACISSVPFAGNKVIDASGLVVSPGFIDIHGHIDGDIYCGELSLRQGITTTIGGNCGLSPINIGDFFSTQDREGFVINQAELVGHSFTLRNAVGLNNVYSPASNEQILSMEYLTEKALDEGASGLSFGLDYAPGCSYEEVLALSKIAAKRNKLISIHTRVLKEDDIDSLYEVINISRSTGAAVLVSHFIYQYNPIIDKALEIIETAISQGLNIRIDSGMYTSWATSIGTATFDEKNISNGSFSFDHMLVATGKYKGCMMNDDIYKELRITSPHECIIYITGTDENIYKPLLKPYCMPSSDTGPYKKGEGHPQIAGTFPRYFNQLTNIRHDLDIIEAVRKASFLPAATVGLKSKGCLKEGMDADIVIFNSKDIKDTADFPHIGIPDSTPKGVEYVIINGNVALEHNTIKNHTAGRIVTANL